MKLKTTKTISKKIISIEVETIGFTKEEDKMLDMLGEPVVDFEKTYEGIKVSLKRRIRTGFKSVVRFDGTEDILKADLASHTFIEDLKEELQNSMTKIKALYDNIDCTNEDAVKIIPIEY